MEPVTTASIMYPIIMAISGAIQAGTSLWNADKTHKHGDQQQKRLIEHQNEQQEKGFDFKREEIRLAAANSRALVLEQGKVTFFNQEWPLNNLPDAFLGRYVGEGNSLANNPPATVILIPPKVSDPNMQYDINTLVNVRLHEILRQAYAENPQYPVVFESNAWRRPDTRGGAADTHLYSALSSLPVLMLQCDINAGLVSIWGGGWSLGGPKSSLAPVVTVPLTAIVSEGNHDTTKHTATRQIATGIAALLGVTMLGQLDAYFLQQNYAVPRLPNVYSNIRSNVLPELQLILDRVAQAAALNYELVYNALLKEKEEADASLVSRLSLPLECAGVLAALPGHEKARRVLDYALLAWLDAHQLGTDDKKGTALLQRFVAHATRKDYDLMVKLSHSLELLHDEAGAVLVNTAKKQILEKRPLQPTIIEINDWL